MKDAYEKMQEESKFRARDSGMSTIMYWLENDIDVDIKEMPIPHYRPTKYIKTALCWSFFYLKHEFKFDDAIKDIISRGGDTMGNATIVGGLIGAACGINGINRS